MRLDLYISHFGPLEYKLLHVKEDLEKQSISQDRVLRNLMGYIVTSDSSQGLQEHGIIEYDDQPVNFISFLAGCIGRLDSTFLTADQLSEFRKSTMLSQLQRWVWKRKL